MTTDIEWCDETWNVTRGCRRVSAGCEHCYAERQAGRFSGKGMPYDGLVKLVKREVRQFKMVNGEPTGDFRTVTKSERHWTGKGRFVAERLADPLHWRKPKRIFVNSMSDLFYEEFTNEQIAAVFGVMAACPQHTFQVLTKRERMRKWFEWALDGTARGGFYDATFLNHLTSKAGLRWEDHPRWLAHCEDTEDTCSRWPLPNVWLGVSVENQDAADERIPELLRTPAAVRFLSCEPLLGKVVLGDVAMRGRFIECPDENRGEEVDPCVGCEAVPNDGLHGGDYCGAIRGPHIDWVIAGCESGPGARSCDVEWLRSLRDQCAAAGVPYFLKQAVEDRGLAVDITGACSTPVPQLVSGPLSHQKGSVIGLPYLDGRQHVAFPEPRSGR